MSHSVSSEQVRRYVDGAFGPSWASRDALVREANNRWAPATVIDALMSVPDRFYRNADELDAYLFG